MNSNKTIIVYGLVLASSLGMITQGYFLGFSGSTQYINEEDVKVATVETGEFSQIVNGYGQLQSKDKRLITATSQAMVDEILLKPGAQVQKNDTILILKNPQLEMALREELNHLQNIKSTRRKTKLEQQREMLLQESSLSELSADVELANLMVEAQSSLVEAGIVSELEFRKSKLKAEQLNNRIALEQTRLLKLAEVHREQLAIIDESIAQKNQNFLATKRQFEKLIVKAGIDGVLQRLSVTLGQSVSIGEELALVGSMKNLIAEIQVPQLQANLIRIGSTVEVDSRNGLINGQVVRIDPVVKNGAVFVEVDIPMSNSLDIRPMQSINALIFGESRGNVSSVKKPIGINEDSHAYVYKITSENTATKVQVQFGQLSNQQIEIVSGLKPGDEIIVSSSKVTNDAETIRLVKKG